MGRKKIRKAGEIKKRATGSWGPKLRMGRGKSWVGRRKERSCEKREREASVVRAKGGFPVEGGEKKGKEGR